MLDIKSFGNTRAHQAELRDATVRKFDGGWNVVNNDLNMDTRFAKVLDNFERDPDGNLSLRPGTVLFSRVSNLSNITNCIYFDNMIVTTRYSGEIYYTDNAGVSTLAPLAVGTLFWPLGNNFTNFNTFASHLIIHDGINKPLMIHGDPVDPLYRQVAYLVDPTTGSNINTPVGLFGCTHGQYHIIAGSPAKPSTIFISARGSPGTFVGDPAPNDAIEIDLGSRVAGGSSNITGLLSHGDKLVVCFEQGVIPMTLGVYTGTPSVHTPSDDGFIQNFGCLSHRSLVSVGDAAFYADALGVVSLIRNSTLNSTRLKPDRASFLIDPETTLTLRPLANSSNAQLVNAVYDLRNKRYMLFVPVYDEDTGVLIESVCYSYTYIPSLKVSAWARLKGWSWSCACRTALQNIIFCAGNKIYKYNFDSEDNSDFLNDVDYEAGAGVAITGIWEWPWADFNARRKKKHSKVIALETEGTASFTLRTYVDRILYDTDGNDNPLLTMDFIGGSAGGYGTENYGIGPYGSGRLTADERLTGWEAEFNLMKLKVSVTTKLKLKFISVSQLYLLGTYRR